MKKAFIILTAVLTLLLSACVGEAPVTPDLGGDFLQGEDGNGKIPSYNAVDADSAKKELAAIGITASESEKVTDGLTLYKYTLESGSAYVMAVELDKLTLTASTPFNTKPFGTNQSLTGQKAVLEKEFSAVWGGVSANPLNISVNEPAGVIIKGGKHIYDVGFNDGSVYFGIYEDGKAFAASFSEYEKIYRNKVTTMVSGEQFLINNGKKQALYGDDDTAIDRIGAGFTADRQTAVLVYGESIDMQTLQSLLYGHSCSVAINLIDGTLARMTCKGESFGTNIPVGPALFVTAKS